MDLGLSKDEMLEVWQKAWAGVIEEYWPDKEKRPDDIKETPPGGALGPVVLALGVYMVDVVRANNRRLQEQLEKAGVRLE